MVLSKRVVGAKQKNRRCKTKESTMRSKRIDDAKRKQSIYSQISLNCYATGGNKHPKPISYLLLLCHVQLTKQKSHFLQAAFIPIFNFENYKQLSSSK